MTTAHEYAQANNGRFYQQFKDLIRIPSISTDPERADDVARAADWLVADMERVGFDSVERITMPDGRHPTLLGTWNGAGAAAPTVLIYCHYDVQPAEMADGWQTPPFEPVERDGMLYARGSTDSKINVMTQLKAIESLLATPEKSPVNIKLVLEGEEESGSETINAFAAAQPDRLQADVCVISDGAIIAPEKPSLVIGLRGIAALELHVSGPARDLHSGHYGGNVHNPAQAICEIIAQLHDENGTVTVPGFYDNVVPLDEAERAALVGADPWYDANWAKTAAAPQPWGEAGYSIHEKAGIRPTLEVNGIWGGYSGAGLKTVLPAQAAAKISCRLVANQDPQRIVQLVADYIAQLTPPTVTSKVVAMDAGSTAVRLPLASRAIQAASVAYATHWETEPIYEMAGGSVPIASTLQHLAAEMVIMGYTYKGGQAHGPNEHIVIDNFPRGVGAAITFLQYIGASDGC